MGPLRSIIPLSQEAILAQYESREVQLGSKRELDNHKSNHFTLEFRLFYSYKLVPAVSRYLAVLVEV